DWVQHIQMYFSFYSNCTEKERTLIALSLTNQGYANTLHNVVLGYCRIWPANVDKNPYQMGQPIIG
ncbi:hypothetical protein PAXRUDRAFT_178171, partial [Paxillus rubicundulus Ve08.2h10]